MQCNAQVQNCAQAELVASESAVEEKAWALQQSKNYRFHIFCILPIFSLNTNQDIAVF